MSSHFFSGGEVLLDRYRVDRYLDEGGMQQVYVATDLTFERDVVLKVPKNPSAEKRFARSARMSARVTHANVAKTLDYFEADSRSYLVEEYIQGSDLKQLLDMRFAYFDPHLAGHVIHQLAKGLAAAHHAGVFHRDVKPSNVMVSGDANLSMVKITDFGIAKMTEEELVGAMKDESSISGSQTVLGALPYMAPEMVRDPKKADLPADVWALGAMLYALLSGAAPFGAGLAAIPAILEAKPPPKPVLFDRKLQFSPLTDGLWSIVEACLTKNPDKRPTADELVQVCARLCYSDAPRLEGTISRFRHGTGAWGFIGADPGFEVFFHIDSYYGEKPKPGVRVNFACFEGHPSHRAFPVLPLK